MKLGWIDFSPEDRKRAIDALNALRNRTEDELGTGVIRDAFADVFFPGTSTIQTRAKYFILVPCAIRMTLENLQGAPVKSPAMEELRKIEGRCAKQMWDNCDHDETASVIGRQEIDNPKWVVRPPSEIYWAGLRTFGIIFNVHKSVGTWINGVGRAVCDTGKRSERSRRDDEDGIADDEDTRLVGWKANVVIPEDIFQTFSEVYRAKTLKPELTRREAEFLRERIHSATPGSLLAFHLSPGRIPPHPNRRSDEEACNETDTSFCKFAQFLKGRVPSEMESLLDNACEFNRLNFAANVLYNKMLGVPEAETKWGKIRDSIPDWMEATPFSIPERFRTSRTDSAVKFLGQLQKFFQNRDYGEAERLIAKRERDCCNAKNKKAKLGNSGSKEWVGVKWHDFRLAIAARILNDIANPEGHDNA